MFYTQTQMKRKKNRLGVVSHTADTTPNLIVVNAVRLFYIFFIQQLNGTKFQVIKHKLHFGITIG